MNVVISLLATLFGLVYLLVALFMVLFIGLMAHGGFIVLTKALGIEL